MRHAGRAQREDGDDQVDAGGHGADADRQQARGPVVQPGVVE